jgi:hypothetical protein
MFFLFSGGGIRVAPKKISAKELIADVKAQMSDNELMAKHNISAEGLQRLFQQLLDKGLVNESDLSPRRSKGQEVTLSMHEEDEQRLASPLPSLKTISPSEDLPAEAVEQQTPQPAASTEGKSIGSTARSVLESAFSALLAVLRVGWTAAKAIWNWLKSRRRATEVVQHPGIDSTPDRVTPGPDSSGQGSVAMTRGRGDLKVESEFAYREPKPGSFRRIRAVPAALAGFFVSLFTGQFLLKLVGYLVVLGLFCLSMAAILQKHELSVLVNMEGLVHINPVPKTKELQKVSVCEAIRYLEHFMDFDYVKNNSEAVELFNQLKEERASLSARSKSMLSSFWKGAETGACPEDMLSATISDFAGVGSFRTLYEHYTGKEMSEFTLWLARIDGLMTTVTIGSGVVTIVGGVITFTGVGAPVGVPLATGGSGVTTTAAVGKTASVFFKTAHRLNKISAPFQKELVVIFKEANKLKKAEPLKPAITSLQKLWGIGGLKGTGQLSLISRAKNLKELDHMVEMAGVYGKNTAKFLDLGGDKAVAIYRQHGKSKLLTEAMNTSIQYGEKGTDVLLKAGPEKFMKGMARKTSKAAQVAKGEVLPTTKFGPILHTLGISKYTLSVRGFKSFWDGHLTALLVQVTKWFPQWAIFSIAACSGLFVVGLPSMGVYRVWQGIRTPA